MEEIRETNSDDEGMDEGGVAIKRGKSSSQDSMIKWAASSDEAELFPDDISVRVRLLIKFKEQFSNQ